MNRINQHFSVISVCTWDIYMYVVCLQPAYVHRNHNIHYTLLTLYAIFITMGFISVLWLTNRRANRELSQQRLAHTHTIDRERTCIECNFTNCCNDFTDFTARNLCSNSFTVDQLEKREIFSISFLVWLSFLIRFSCVFNFFTCFFSFGILRRLTNGSCHETNISIAITT